MAPAKLRTRPPSGLPAVPIILVHGPPKAGRTVATVKLSAAPWIDRMFVAQIGTQAWDDYGAHYPRFEILEHDGTTTSILEQVEAAAQVPPAEGKLNAIVIDDATELWDTLKILAETRQRRNERTQKALKADPEAEVDPTMDKWNDVKARWARIGFLMKRSGAVGVWVCRGADVTKVDSNGNPIQGQQVYRIEAEKSTPAMATMTVRVYPDHRAVLEAVTSLKPEVLAAVATKGGYTLPEDNPLAHAIELVRGGDSWASGSALVVGQGTALSVAAAKRWVIDTIKALVPKMALDDTGNVAQVAGAIWTRLWSDRQAPGQELTEDMLAHMREQVPVIIADTLLGPVVLTPAATPVPVPVAEVPLTEVEPTEQGDAADVCPVCHEAKHIGSCVVQARAQVGARARTTETAPAGSGA